MKQYRKRPVVIEAEQWIPGQNDALIEDIGVINRGDKATMIHIETVGKYRVPAGCSLIPTLEGQRVASPFDWIIKGVKGEIYPCKSDIFAATYEEVTGVEVTQ